MSYITKDLLEQFVNKYPEDETLVEHYAKAAEEEIENYLGYSPEKKEYTTLRYGDGGTLFELDAKPLIELESISENGKELSVSQFRIKSGNYLEYSYGKNIFSKISLYSLTYIAGYEEVPQKIITVGLQIASLMWESEGGNIAVSSTSFADNGSRVFNNFKAERFLSELAPYRLTLQRGI